MSDDQMPPLQDFQSQLITIKANRPKQQKSQEDYTKMNTRHIQDQNKRAKQVQQANQNALKINQKIQKKQKQVQQKKSYGGFAKGFLGGNNKSNQKKEQKITQIKVTKKQDPLRIPEVQQAMKMNNYLEDTRKQWMTENFLNNVTSNQKINKLFSNPEYMKAIDLFKTNPRQAMMKYGNNKQFMQGFQQFCKMMGMQFQNLAQQQKSKK